MSDFFEGTRPGKEVTFGKATFELPILYFRDDMFALFFTADFAKLKSLIPSDKLHPIRVSRRRALLGIAAFNYLDTSIGPYGEVGVVVPVVRGKRPALPLLPGLLEGWYPNFGALVLHLPVTTQKARDAGRGQWGYTKFVSDMQFDNTPEYLECSLSGGKSHILTLHVAKRGWHFTDNRPVVTFTVLDGNLIQTVIPQKGRCRASLSPKGSYLTLGDHEMAESIRQLELSQSPLQSRYYVERSAILPAGEIIEKGVRPLDGIRGTDRKGKLVVRYGGY